MAQCRPSGERLTVMAPDFRGPCAPGTHLVDQHNTMLNTCHRLWRSAVIALLFVAIAQPNHAQVPAPVPAGPFVAGPIRFQLAIFYAGSPSKPPESALDQRLSTTPGAAKRLSALPTTPSGAVLQAFLISSAQTDYRPPDMDMIQRFGRGLTRDQAQALQGSTKVLILDFAHPAALAMSAYRSAIQLAELVAKDTNGFLWDEETREVFTPGEWHTRRLESWRGDAPDITKHTVIHAYRGDKQVRAITLGMAKFGLPDVVVDDFSWSLNRTMGHLVVLFCQAMVEGAVATSPGKLDLNLRSIKNDAVRQPQLESLKPNATAVAKLSLGKGKWESGDPRNRLIEIGFDRYEGPDRYARQTSMLSELFGSEDSAVLVKHTTDLLVASEAAKAKLPSLQQAFKRGLQPGEYILVKAPFETPGGGNEWMWVEVSQWNGNEITGLLKSSPINIPGLHGGQSVTVSQRDVFDYIRRDATGHEEGNETGKILLRQGGRK